VSPAVYDHNVQDITAFILAGGKSTRMGRDKGFVEFQGRTLLDHSLELARGVATEVLIVGDRDKFSAFASVVEDVFPDCGPLGGIHAALQTSRSALNLVIAVDLPFVEFRFLEYLLEQARATTALVTVPRVAGGWQPLCAVYRREFANWAEHALQRGRNKIDSLFSEVETRVLAEDELTQSGFSSKMFQNLNTPEDLERARIDR